MSQKEASKTLTAIIRKMVSQLGEHDKEFCAGLEAALGLAIMVIESTPSMEVEA
jgi:hypothetical protein